MTTKNGNGRPTKLTPELIEKICSYISAGNYRTVACQAVGISFQCHQNWLKRGERESTGIFFDFVEAIKKAEANAEARNVAIIQKAAMETWQAAAWWLERSKPDRWAKKEMQEITGSAGGAIIIKVKYDNGG